MTYQTLLQDYLRLSAKRFPDKIALIQGDVRLTYAFIDSQSERLAEALCTAGLQRQDRVVIFLDNTPETVISLYGILKAGGVFVILNPTLRPKKLAYVLRDSGARFLITHAGKSQVVSEALADGIQDCRIIWQGPESGIPEELMPVSLGWDAVLAGVHLSQGQTAKGHACIDADLAALIYTSGSTGEPKGVMSPHRNMLAAARSIIQYLENREDDIVLNVLPLSFDYGLYQVLMAFMYGGTVVLEKSFLFIHKVLERIGQEKVTGLPIVPTVLAMMLKLQDLTKYNVGSLRYITNTGAALPIDHIRRLRELFPSVRIYSMFGLTECKRVCYLPPEELDRRPGSVGKAIPNCEVFLLDENGREVGPDEQGQLVVRGSNVMPGYWNAHELTAQFFKPGKRAGELLLYSGDYFKKDGDGFLYFLGRKDDMIKSRGERVSAREVENVLHEIPGVTEAAVIGVADDILGQAIKAYVVCESAAGLNENAILKYCAANLEPYAIPKYVVFVESLPKTPHGKIDKKALKSEA